MVLPSIPVYRSWRIYIDDTEYTYLNIHFTKTHPSSYPDTFTITLDGERNIVPFAVVEIEKDGVLRFYGYVEKRKWTSDVNTIISGRCRKVITWKKWTERYEEARGNMQGFFGVTYPEEVFKFIIRCPISDIPSETEDWGEYPHQKIGWGINPDPWTCSANTSSSGTDPIYTKLRLLDFFWRNRGTDSDLTTLLPNSNAGVMQWTENGVGPNPWDYVDNCSLDTDYISEATIGHTSYAYGFTNLPLGASGVNDVKLRLRLVKVGGWFDWTVTVQVEVYDGISWQTAGYVTFNNRKWRYSTINLNHILNTVDKVELAQIRLTKSAGSPSEVRCSCMALRVDYSSGGSQEVGDYFKIDLGEERERVCGIIIQSRAHSDQFPCNYKIETSTDDTIYTERASLLNNSCGQDIIHSWSPISVKQILITIIGGFFFDDFETGDLRKWTGTVVGGAGSVDVSSVKKYEGIYSLRCDNDVPAASFYAYKNFGSESNTMYMDWYMNPDTPAGAWGAGNWLICATMQNKDDPNIALYLYIMHDGANIKWRLYYWDNVGGNWSGYSGSNVVWNTWYHIQLGVYTAGGGAGWVRLWVNGTSEIFVAGLTNDAKGPIDRIECHSTSSTWAQDVWHDYLFVSNILNDEGIWVFKSWEISQIYVYECDEEKYCIVEDA